MQRALCEGEGLVAGVGVHSIGMVAGDFVQCSCFCFYVLQEDGAFGKNPRKREGERERGRNGRAESSSRGWVELGNVSVMHGISW